MITICLLATTLIAFQNGDQQKIPKPERQWRTPVEIEEHIQSLDSLSVTTIGFSNNGDRKSVV